MTNPDNLKIIKDLISQTPLIIDPQRDGTRFQNALAGLSDSKLEKFYQGLNAEERRRFHYAANVCLGYDSWCQLYKSLVVTATQGRLADRMEEAYAFKAQELSRREAEMDKELLALGEQIMSLETENKALLKENQQLSSDLETVREEKGLLEEQRKRMQEMVERYRRLIADLKGMLLKSGPSPSPPK
jgi:septal ring factor EnvC (AmiA/AmiB activator)